MNTIHHLIITAIFASLFVFQTFAQPTDLSLFPNSEVTPAQGEAFAGQSERVSPTGPILPGEGFSRLSYAARDTALRVDGPVIEERPELQVTYNFELIDSYTQLARSLQIDASASVHYLAGSASARVSLLQSSTITNQSVYVLVRMRVTNKIRQLKSFELSDAALTQLKTITPANFYTMYGDGFVYRMGFGSEMYALLELQAKDEKSRQELRVAVEGSYSAFSASASLTDQIERIARDHHVKVYYSQSGGDSGDDVSASTPSKGGVLVLDADELILRTRKFTKEAREHPQNAEIIWADVLDYAACRNKPLGFKPFDTTFSLWVVSGLSELYLDLRQLSDSWTYYLQNKSLFGAAGGGRVPPTDEDLTLLHDLMKRIERTITYLGLFPSKADDPSVKDVMRLRLLAESVRRSDQQSSPTSAATATFLGTLDAAPHDNRPEIAEACLGRDTASAQLACLLRRALPSMVVHESCKFRQGEITVNGDFATLQTVPLPMDCAEAGPIQGVWLSLTRPDREQFDLAHVVRSVSSTAINFQVCVRRGGNPGCGCEGYDQVKVRWAVVR